MVWKGCLLRRLLKAAGKKCPELQEPAKQLVEIWKKLVPSESAPNAQKRYADTPICTFAVMLMFCPITLLE